MRKPAPPRRPSAPLTPIARPVRQAVIGDEVVATPKADLLRSDDYRRFVASHACFGCGLVGRSQAAHPNAGKGMALKTDDRLCFPLCAGTVSMGCHQKLDLSVGMTRDARRALEAQYTARMQDIARAAGRPEFA